MSYQNSRSSNLISSKNVIFNKQAQDGNSFGSLNQLDLSNKHSALIHQLEILEKQQEQIITEAENSKQKILDDAKKASIDIEKNAYENGYSEGLKNGYEDGYKEAYDKALEEAQNEINSKVKEATNILLSSKSIIYDYAINNKDKILDLAIAIAEKALGKELENSNSMDCIFEQALLEIKDKKSLVIKVNPNNKELIDNKVSSLKDELSLTDDIHIIALSSIKEGDAIIESDSGTILVGISVVLDNIRAELS